MPPTARDAQARLRDLGSSEAAALAARYFKTGPGQYGEGDVFLGVRVPPLRKLAGEFRDLADEETLILLHSEVHEERLLALLILVRVASGGDEPTKRRLYDLYLANTRFVNNWDLVDSSAREIVGGYLHDKGREPLYGLARSASLWERRIAIIATHHFIARHDYSDTLGLSQALLSDPHDLIHKAAGWMLREVGKRDQATLEGFLKATTGRCRGPCCGTPSSDSRPTSGGRTSRATSRPEAPPCGEVRAMEHSRDIFADIPASLPEELVQTLVGTPGVRIERIVSLGHASPEGFWYDQDAHEWVLLLAGAARLRFEGEEPIELRPGSFVNIAAHRRHRVEWTDPSQPTVWLAVHYADHG